MIAFLVGVAVGAVAGVLLMSLAVMASQADRQIDAMHEQKDRRREPRLITDPRLGYKHQLEELRKGWDREHPEQKDNSTW